MRTISPHTYHKKVARRRLVRRLQAALFLVVVVAGIGVGVWWWRKPTDNKPATEQSQQEASVVQQQEETPKEIGTFTGEEFKNLYNSFSYPNTTQLTEPPFITGDPGADARIRMVAEERGYRLRSIARDTLGEADGSPLQLLAMKPWEDLKEAAAKDGIILTATWGYRSIEDQRQLFLDSLYGQGIYPFDIAAGLMDEEIKAVLELVAPPGYSRHHTGFTVDLTCGTDGLTDFANTPCYEWLAVNNYERMKALGWVPSYPKGATLQGPEPEPWEYIWVGPEALYKTE